MTTIKASVHISMKRYWCEDCNRRIMSRTPYLRLFGSAEPDDPKYEMCVCISCARKSDDKKVITALTTWDEKMSVRINEFVSDRMDALVEASEKRKAQEPDFEHPTCNWTGCDELVDVTKYLGVDTSCPYHRLLFDHWLYNVARQPIETEYADREERNAALDRWGRAVGKKKCDEIVDKMSRDGINWVC